MGAKKPFRLVGVDIRQNFIRLVGLSGGDFGYQIEMGVNLELQDAEISDEVIASAIKSTLRQASPKFKQAAVALSHTAIIFKEFQVPVELSRKEINKFLHFHFAECAKEYSAGDLGFDCQVTEAGNDSFRLQAVAVRRAHADKWVKLLLKAGLYSEILDIDIYAIERAIRLQLENVEGLAAVVNMDHGQVLIIVLDSKKIVYVHEDVFDIDAVVSIDKVLELFDTKLRLIYSALSQPIEVVVLGGEKALLPGLVDAVSDRFDLRVVLANPFMGMKVANTVSQGNIFQLAPLMLISCGLALRVRDADHN